MLIHFISLSRKLKSGSIEVEISMVFRCRMHYGHPDVFDRVFHITRGGISKASRVINISEDIYAGMSVNSLYNYNAFV